MNYELLGRRIRDRRLLSRLTIEELAEKVHKSTNYIGQIERNDGKPSLETIVDIANALGTTVDALLTDSIFCNEDDKTAEELSLIVQSLDRRGKEFLLDVAKKYKYFHIDTNSEIRK